MIRFSGIWFAGAVCGLLLLPVGALAQDGMYVDYSDEEAAGPVEYSDLEAAGTAESAGEAEPAADVEPAAEAEGEADWSVSYDSEGGAEEDEEELLEWEASGEPVSSERLERKPWEWGAYRHHSTLAGTTGLLHMAEAGSGEVGTFGLGVHGTWFTYTDYLIDNDKNTGMWGDVNIRITPLEFLEIHYGIAASANYNDKEYPELFQTLGDMDLGLKGFFSPAKPLTIGLDVGMFMLNSVGEVAMNWKGTSFGLDALVSVDFTEVNIDAPIRLHLLVGYFFDRAGNLIEDIERDNGGCGSDIDGDGNVEYRGCLSPVERTALGIDRNDQFRLGLGIDALLPYVSPMVEYNLEIPVNRQDFICPKDAPGSYDSCMVQESGGGFRQILTIGARVLLPVDDLAIDIGVDIGLSGYAPTVHEMAATVPWRLIFGASYNFDPFPPPPPEPVVVAPPVVEEEPPPPPPSRISGLVHDETSIDTPVSGAVVSYEGLDLNAQVAGVDGRFLSYELPAGPIAVLVKAEGYHEGTFNLEIPETGDVEQSFPLKAMPKLGTIMITVVDDEDKPLSGVTVKAEGAHEGEFRTDASGMFEFESEEGKIKLVADVEGFLSKRVSVKSEAETKTKLQIQLRPKPKRSMVVVKAKRIRIKRKIHFEVNSDVIDPRSFALLDEVADTLINNPQIKLVEIQGHTDDRGKRDYNIDLSDRRASSVRRYLIDSGVEATRLDSKGYGPARPVAPNVTRSGRARNRRVEFHIKDGAE